MVYKRPMAFLLFVPFLLTNTSTTLAWGDEGHRYVNRVAADRLPNDMPEFFRRAAVRLSFLGPEPDRWRDNQEVFSALREATGPDHFIDIDRPEDFAALPNDRYKYSDWLKGRGQEPKDIGYLPYSILEGYQKIQVLFRLWRDPKHAQEREQIEQNIIYYAGVLGHYVADGSQPLHTTIHYNGWSTSSNPAVMTREPLHWRFEGEYVKARVRPEDFAGLVKPSQQLKDPFSDILSFLFASHSEVNKLYQMDKTSRWDAKNQSPEAKRFVAGRLAAGSQMLTNLWYTAWLGSASSKADAQ
jgi:hypothetical protein